MTQWVFINHQGNALTQVARLAIALYPCYHGSVIRPFVNSGTPDIFNGKNSQQARRTCPRVLWPIAARKLDQLDSVEEVQELRVPPGNRLERLSGKRKGQYNIRINEQYRICFAWSADGPLEVEIVDYH